MSTKITCPDCGQNNTQKRGGNRYYCHTCKGYKTLKTNESNFEYSEDYQRGTAHIVTSLPRIMSEKDLLQFLKIDENIWQIDKVVYGKSEGYRKDRKVSWHVRKGQVTHGDVEDSGKLLIEPMFSVKVYLSRKTAEIDATAVLRTLIEDARKYSPKYQTIKYNKLSDGHLLEIGMPDLQLGRLVDEEEAGLSSSPVQYVGRATQSITKLLDYAHELPISRIVFPVGNDFFNSNTAAMTTAHGTPQQDDVRWQRTFSMGRRMLVSMIDIMTTIAPVDVLIVPGNHDEERIFYMGEALEAWYHHSANVAVNNSLSKRKYYLFERNLIGFTHGYWEKMERLASLMAYEVPEWWALTHNREWHLGDKHHKADMIYKTEEMANGVVVRILRSLANPSVWEYDKGFVGSAKATEAFVWHPEQGVVAQFSGII
jgi:hypothetical protein